MKIAFEELQPAMPNLTGCFLDDFFVSDRLNQKLTISKRISAEVHAHDLRLSVVLYSDQDGFKPEFKPKLDLCDETSLWFWNSSNIVTMADNVKRCREFIGLEKDLLLGLYMWDFTLGAPVPAERMEMQRLRPEVPRRPDCNGAHLPSDFRRSARRTGGETP